MADKSKPSKPTKPTKPTSDLTPEAIDRVLKLAVEETVRRSQDLDVETLVKVLHEMGFAITTIGFDKLDSEAEQWRHKRRQAH